LRPRELVALLDKYVVKQVRALLIGSLSLSRSLERAWRPRTRVTRVTRVPSRVTRRATGATRVTPRASRHLSRLTPVTFPVVDPPPSPLPLCRPASLPYRLCAAPYQAEAKKVLAVAVCDHYNHARACLLADAAAADGVAPAGADGRRAPSPRELEHTKPNVLLLGSTGVGKTYLMRTLARLIGARPARAPTRGASRASLALLVLFQRVCACRPSVSPPLSFSLLLSHGVQRTRARKHTHTHTHTARTHTHTHTARTRLLRRIGSPRHAPPPVPPPISHHTWHTQPALAPRARRRSVCARGRNQVHCDGLRRPRPGGPAPRPPAGSGARGAVLRCAACRAACRRSRVCTCVHVWVHANNL
jgi:hypothetical protein